MTDRMDRRWLWGLLLCIWITSSVRAQEEIPVGIEFVMNTDSSHVMVVCDKGVAFDLMNGTRLAYPGLKNGAVIPIFGKKKYRISHPVGAKKTFTASFYGTELPQRWMSYLPGQTELADISIPGTHDSGTKSYYSIIRGLGRCQNMSIGQQLKDGIRFLDIRLTLSGVNLVIAHGPVNLNLRFQAVLNTCKTFLEKNPEETIIMLVNKATSRGAPIGYAFQLALDLTDAPFYVKSRLPGLEEARGKIILVSRDEELCRVVGGVNLSDGWLKNASFSMKSIDGEIFHIEDEFEHISRKSKVNAWEKNVQLALKNGDGFFISFGSIATGDGTPYDFAWNDKEGKQACNPSFIEYLIKLNVSLKQRRLGTIMLDFYNDGGNLGDHGVRNELPILIMKSNFPETYWKTLLPHL